MKTVALGDVVDFTNGGTPSRSKAEFWGGSIPWITGADITDAGEVSARSFITEAGVRGSSTNVVPRGSILLLTRTSVGKVGVLSESMAINQDITAVTPSKDVDTRYLVHFLRASKPTLLRTLRGATIKGVTRDDVAALEIPLPPLDEQHRIAAILDRADALRAKRRQALAHLDDLTQSVFTAMFAPGAGPVRALGEVTDFFGGTSLPEGQDFAGQGGGSLLMKVSDMNAPGNEEEVVSCALWTDGHVARSATVSAGAVVLPKRGASISTNKKRITTRPTTLDPNLMGVQPRSDVLHSRYLHAWFKSFDLASITSGSTVPQLNKQDLAPLAIYVPPMPQQEEFALRIQNVNSQRAMLHASAERVESLFTSLQAQAFRGEL